jgi:hypothetical protein
MKWWIAAIVAVLGVGLGAAFVDGDPRGLVTGAFTARSAGLASHEGANLTAEQEGALYFAFGDWGALSSEALEVSASPWKLTTALLALRAADGDLDKVTLQTVAEVFRRYGFVVPERIANWPDGLDAPTFDVPMGQNVGFGGRLVPPVGLTVGNISCAGCHASVVYGADGRPDTRAIWLGTPNGSINLQRYVGELYAALRDRPADDVTWAAVQRLYPDTEWREWLALKTVVLPRAAALVADREASIGQLLPFSVGTSGATNGLQALQTRLGVIPSHQLVETSVPISVPELGGRVWRSSLLAGGAYSVPGEEPQRSMQEGDLTPEHLRALASITAFFTVPSMGTTPDTAARHVDQATTIMQWLATYRPQPFPGPIDMALAKRGAEIYALECAGCHGSYEGDRLVEFPNWQGNVGTDRAYLDAFDAATVAAVNGLGYDKLLVGRITKDYVAQPLAGLWSSAPYLHNGSVPTLWHLMHPAERPKAFFAGGHALDLQKVGVAGVLEADGTWAMPPGYVAWTEPTRIDTAIPGLGAGGHEAPFNTISEPDKAALLEYLKRL